MHRQLLILCCIFFCVHLSLAQTKVKIEIEKRIKKEDIPAKILEELMPILASANNIKYYQEQDSFNTFYEVKLKYKGLKISIKYTEGGIFHDLEETIKLSQIPSDAKVSIIGYYSGNAVNYKVKKIQLRYTSDIANPLENYLQNNGSSFETSYEIEAFLKMEKDSESGLYEFLFSRQGALLEKRKIKTREADYVLY
ncbi:MAG: hypothetical protein ACJAT1_001064 [Marivirga sp.]|jgi:hypothetical protein